MDRIRYKQVMIKYFCKILIGIVFLSSCKSGPFNVLRPASPHEVYKRNLLSSGLGESAIAKSWIGLAETVLVSPVEVNLPYREKGYFPPEKVQAAAFRFKMQKGEKLQVKLSKKPADGFRIYTDIWERDENGKLKTLGSSDTVGTALETDIDRTGTFVLRIQPELLAGGEYTLEISSGPSLAYPLSSYKKNQIGSFWGDGRDANTRNHEGIDIFSTFRTPVLASAAGTTRVNENRLGGKVVWLRPDGKDFTIYYAHLDEQTVADGRSVNVGDTIGRMGNTGNTRTTPPHLHLGIYTRDGAVDPLPFFRPQTTVPPPVRADTSLLNSILRTSGNARLDNATGPASQLINGTIVEVRSASANSYRVQLPDGSMGYITSSKLAKTGSLQKRIAGQELPLLDRPDTSAAVKLALNRDDAFDVLGRFENFDFVRFGKETGWVRR